MYRGEVKTRKVLEISDYEWQFECIKKEGDINPYRLYKLWWENGGRHRKQIAKYADLYSVISYLHNMGVGYGV